MSGTNELDFDGYFGGTGAGDYEKVVEAMQPYRVLTDDLRRRVEGGEGSGALLDLGCGTGGGIARALKMGSSFTHFIGVERMPFALNRARQRFLGDDRVTIIDGDLTDDTWVDEVLGVGAPVRAVMACNVFYAIPPKDADDPLSGVAAVLERAKRCSADSLRLAFTVPAVPKPEWVFQAHEDYLRGNAASDVERAYWARMKAEGAYDRVVAFNQGIARHVGWVHFFTEADIHALAVRAGLRADAVSVTYAEVNLSATLLG